MSGSEEEIDARLATMASRIRRLRADRFGSGEAGIAMAAAAFDVPVETWRNFEQGYEMPLEIMLRFIGRTNANLSWLMTGRGRRYIHRGLPPWLLDDES